MSFAVFAPIRLPALVAENPSPTEDDVRWAPKLLQKISYLASEVADSSDFVPTTQQAAVQEELKQLGDKYQQEYQQLVAKDVAAFNAMLREKNIPNIIVKAP